METEEKMTTIPVSEGIKKRLEKLKGDLSWDSFFTLVADYLEEMQKDFEKDLKRFNLTEEELEAIEESYKERHKSSRE